MKLLNLKSPGWYVFLLFLVLKLTHVVDWSWVWVTAPLWICAAAVVVGYVTAYLVVRKARKAIAARIAARRAAADSDNLPDLIWSSLGGGV